MPADAPLDASRVAQLLRHRLEALALSGYAEPRAGNTVVVRAFGLAEADQTERAARAAADLATVLPSGWVELVAARRVDDQAFFLVFGHVRSAPAPAGAGAEPAGHAEPDALEDRLARAEAALAEAVDHVRAVRAELERRRR